MSRNKQWPVDYLLQENPEMEWDDIHDVREIANILAGMVNDLEEKVYDKTWYRLPDNKITLVPNCFYLIAHPDFNIPLRAKYHDLGNDDGYFSFPQILGSTNTYFGCGTIHIDKIKYYMPLPEMPDDYKEEE